MLNHFGAFLKNIGRLIVSVVNGIREGTTRKIGRPDISDSFQWSNGKYNEIDKLFSVYSSRNKKKG